MKKTRGYSLTELLISMGIGAVVLAGLISLVFILYRDKNIIDQSNSLEETRRLISLQIHARMNEALNTEVWLNTETLRAIGIPIDSVTPPAIQTGLFPSGIVFKNMAIGTSGIVPMAETDVLFFISKDPVFSSLKIANDISGSPAFADTPHLFRFNDLSPYFYLESTPNPSLLSPGSLAFIGTPAGALITRVSGTSGPRVDFDQSPFGTFEGGARSAVRIVSRGMFFGKLKVSAVGIDADTRDFVVVDVQPSSWAIRERYPLVVERMIFDPGFVAPSNVITFDPLARAHTVSIQVKRILLTGQKTEPASGADGASEYAQTDSILSISL